MRLFRLTALLATTCLLSACASGPNGKVIAGGVIATSAVVVVAHAGDGEECNHSWTSECNPIDNTVDGAVSAVIAMGLVVLGGGLVLSGLKDAEEEQDAQREQESHIVETRPATTPAPSSYAADVPASAVILDRVENRLAVQASLIARAGNCSSAIATGNELAKRDPDLFAKLLAADVDLKTCYDDARATSENPPSP